MASSPTGSITTPRGSGSLTARATRTTGATTASTTSPWRCRKRRPQRGDRSLGAGRPLLRTHVPQGRIASARCLLTGNGGDQQRQAPSGIAPRTDGPARSTSTGAPARTPEGNVTMSEQVTLSPGQAPATPAAPPAWLRQTILTPTE